MVAATIESQRGSEELLSFIILGIPSLSSRANREKLHTGRPKDSTVSR
jgi:hypothetical protein